MIDPAAVRRRQERLAESLRAGAPHATRETGASSPAGGSPGAGSGATKRFRIVDLDDPDYPERPTTSGNWLICRFWDGITETGTIIPRVESPDRATIASGGLMTRPATVWVDLGVVASDRVQITDAQQDGNPDTDADQTYEIASVTPTTITLTGWEPTEEYTADFKVGPDTIKIAKPELLRRTPFDTVALARASSPPLGSIVDSTLTASGVNWQDAGVVGRDRVQIFDATQRRGGETVNLLADTYPISVVAGETLVLDGWPHGEFVTTCKFRVGPPGRRWPRDGIEYLYATHTDRTAKALVEAGEDPGARERQQVTDPYALLDEVYAVAFTTVEQNDPDTSLWLAVSDPRAWAMRDA